MPLKSWSEASSGRPASTTQLRRRSGSSWRDYGARRASPRCVVPTARQSKRSFDERGEGIAESLYYSWSKEFLEGGKNRLAGDTARQATSTEVKELRSESAALKEVVAELTLENRLLKKSMIGDGEFEE